MPRSCTQFLCIIWGVYFVYNFFLTSKKTYKCSCCCYFCFYREHQTPMPSIATVGVCVCVSFFASKSFLIIGNIMIMLLLLSKMMMMKLCCCYRYCCCCCCCCYYSVWWVGNNCWHSANIELQKMNEEKTHN